MYVGIHIDIDSQQISILGIVLLDTHFARVSLVIDYSSFSISYFT